MHLNLNKLFGTVVLVIFFTGQTLVTSACQKQEKSNDIIHQTDNPITTDPNTVVTAQQWNKDVVGWNLGNQLECTPPGFESESFDLRNPDNADQAETGWGNPVVTRRVIKAIKAAGFNAVRVPVRWQCHITNAKAMSISPTWLARVKEIVDWCLAEDLKVIINVHHDKWLEGRATNLYKEENCQKLALLWANIAMAFRQYDYRVAFAGTNEVHIRDNWERPTDENLAVQNAYNQTFVDVVRATGGNNEKRHLLVQTYACNPYYGIDGAFIVPNDLDENGNSYMSIEFHFYNPWTYAGGTTYYYWGAPYKQWGACPEDEHQMTDLFDKAVLQWSAKGLGVCIGEWGISNHYKTDEVERIHQNMTYYCQYYVKQTRLRGFSTFYWDNNYQGNGEEKFGVFDRNKGMKVVAPWIIEGITRGRK